MLQHENVQLAEMLEHVAQLLQIRRADPYRVAAYHRAARAVLGTNQLLREAWVAEGISGLRRATGVGPSIASVIGEYLESGRVRMLEQLMAEIAPEELFTLVPGIGHELARRIKGELKLEKLEDLELAAYDGRLAGVNGFGVRRIELVRDALAGILGRSVPRPPMRAVSRLVIPPVSFVLDVDAQYRREAEAGKLRRIAPRRFNPKRRAWLPLLHTQRGRWSFTALFSNTPRAHELGMTGDWVVLFYRRENQGGQCTVVTERRGLMAGKRVIRGRESECRAFYYLGSPASGQTAPGQLGLFAAGAGSENAPVVAEVML